ncbi:MAG: dihydrofolate reductase [Cytophagales bacterium]|nr:MAG: dihydrofolate reductase [Cytophagales bacterium]
MEIALIVAIASNGVIGNDNQLVWHLPKDLNYFKSITSGFPIIMGRKTYESIGRPLPNRTNIILSKTEHPPIENCHRVTSIMKALDIAFEKRAEKCFFIGGANLYEQVLPLVTKIYLTEVHAAISGNTKFEFDKSLWKETSRIEHAKDEKHPYDYAFVVLERPQKKTPQ